MKYKILQMIFIPAALIMLAGCDYDDDGSLYAVNTADESNTDMAEIVTESSSEPDEALVTALSNNFSGIDQATVVTPQTTSNNNFTSTPTITVNSTKPVETGVAAIPVDIVSETTVVASAANKIEVQEYTAPVTQPEASPVVVAQAETEILPTESATDAPASPQEPDTEAVTSAEKDVAAVEPETEVVVPDQTENTVVTKEPKVDTVTTTGNEVPGSDLVLVTDPPAVVSDNTNSPLGTNISSIRDWIGTQAFVDVFKSGRAFRQHSSAAIEYDVDGWPVKLNGAVAKTHLLTNLGKGEIPYGRYTVLYDGKGKVNYSGSIVRVVSRQPGKDILDISAGKGSLVVQIEQTDSSDYIRNIRVLMPGGICKSDPLHHVSAASNCNKNDYLDFVTHHQDILFNPDFLRYLSSFKVLRFMDFMDTNNSEVSSWSDLRRFSAATWGSTGDKKSGAPIEVMIELANRLNADPWFCMPHLADDNYVSNFADYVNINLKPGLKAYVEHSNEVWNGMFKQASYAEQRGMAMKLDTNNYNAQTKYHSKRSVEIFKIWANSFNGTDRLVRVMGAHTGNTWLADVLLLPFEDAYKYTDAIAIAPYFGADPVPMRTMSNVDSIFTKLRETDYKHSVSGRLEKVKQAAAVAKKHGVDLIAYEGGQHLVDWTTSSDDQHPNPLFYAANRDPRMGVLYKEYLKGWKDSGGKLFVNFTSPEHWSKYGSWGLKEHLNEPDSQSPKYMAVMEFINTTPRWW